MMTPERVTELLDGLPMGPLEQDGHAIYAPEWPESPWLECPTVEDAAFIAAAPDIAAAYLAEHAEVVALREQVLRVEAVVEQYAVPSDPITDREGKTLPVIESTEPEDVWRLFRDLRAALAGERASDAPEGGGDDLSDIRTDFIDFPTAWRIQRAGVTHHPECSARTTSGAFLCDCGAVTARWEEIRAEQSGGAR